MLNMKKIQSSVFDKRFSKTSSYDLKQVTRGGEKWSNVQGSLQKKLWVPQCTYL